MKRPPTQSKRDPALTHVPGIHPTPCGIVETLQNRPNMIYCVIGSDQSTKWQDASILAPDFGDLREELGSQFIGAKRNPPDPSRFKFWLKSVQ